MPTIKLRTGTTSQWASSNPVLALGEPGYDSDIRLLKVGDGVTRWVDLVGYLNENRVADAYATLKTLDPRKFGAVGDGVADDSASIQAALDEAGPDGAVELPPLTFRIATTLKLRDGTELRGTGTKQSRILVDTDLCAIRAQGGQGQTIRNLKVWNTFPGPRSTSDVEFVSPTKPVVEDVEIDCNGANSGAGGGVRLFKDDSVAGNSFMAQLNRVWIRNGHLRIDGVTDGKVTDCYVWAPHTTGLGAIQVVNSASSWTFTNCDVVPPTGDGAGYYLRVVENVHIQGGLVDGSYATIMTGWGIRAIKCFRIAVRASFWNLGRGAADLLDCRSLSFIGNLISQCNKADGGYPDINNVNGLACVFVGNTHSALAPRTNLGRIYQESGTSSENVIDLNTRQNGTNYYHPAPLIIGGSTYVGMGNRPLSAWPRALARQVVSSETIPQEAIYRGQINFLGGAGLVITLPSAGTFYAGTTVTFKNIGSSDALLAAAPSQTINGATSLSLAPGEAITIASATSTAWQAVGRYV